MSNDLMIRIVNKAGEILANIYNPGAGTALAAMRMKDEQGLDTLKLILKHQPEADLLRIRTALQVIYAVDAAALVILKSEGRIERGEFERSIGSAMSHLITVAVEMEKKHSRQVQSRRSMLGQ